MRHILRNRLFLAISTGHTFVDVLNSAFPVILATLALQLGMSNTQLGLAATVFLLGASVTQPLFGYAADRWGSRELAAGGVLWMGSGFALAGLLDGWPSLLVLMIAGFGSAAYHPQAVMNARHASGDMAASGTSLFFLFGQFGLGGGPALAGVLLTLTSINATLFLLAVPAIPVALFLLTSVPRERVLQRDTSSPQETAGGTALRFAWPILAAFILMLAFRVIPQASTQTFLPKLMGDAGLSADRYGIALAFFMAGSGIGGVLGGYSADRWSGKGTILLSLALAPIPFWAYLQMPLTHPALPLVVGIAGLLIGAPHSIVVLMAQSMLPGRMALASGLVLGFMFAAGATGSFVTGVLADRIGLEQTLLLLPAVIIVAALCTLPLPRRHVRERVPPAESEHGRGHPRTVTR